MLSDNINVTFISSSHSQTKQSAVLLSSSLLNAIPLHSFHLPICTYSFTMLKYYAIITSFSILSLMHYCTYVLLSNKHEADACLILTGKTNLATHIQRLVAILDEETEYLLRQRIRNRTALLIALLRFYLDEYKELAEDKEENLPPIPKEEDIIAAFGHQEQVVHRGEAIKNVDSTMKFDNSLMKLNFNSKVASTLMNTLNSINGKIEVYELNRYSSYLDFVCYFLLKKVEGLPEELPNGTLRYLKIICRLFMSVLYTCVLQGGMRHRLPEHISFLQLEAVVEMMKVFCMIGDKYYEPVMEYVLKHKVYLVHGLQRVATNLRENNQLVMMWYAETNYGETEEQQRAISLVSSFYQQLSLMSYAYEFTVAIWSFCWKQAVKRQSLLNLADEATQVGLRHPLHMGQLVRLFLR